MSLIFVQLGLENFGKTVTDLPFITFARVYVKVNLLSRGTLLRDPENLRFFMGMFSLDFKNLLSPVTEITHCYGDDSFNS